EFFTTKDTTRWCGACLWIFISTLQQVQMWPPAGSFTMQLTSANCLAPTRRSRARFLWPWTISSKLTPAFLGLVLLFQRRWWAAGISALTFAITVGIGYFTIPDAKYFWERAIFDSSRVGNHNNPGAQSVRSVLEREFHIEGGPWWVLAVVVIFVLTCIAVYLACKRRNATVAMALTGIS